VCAGKRNQPVMSGIISPSTTLTFRSRSSHIVLLLQMSREMWQFDNDGEMHFEKVYIILSTAIVYVALVHLCFCSS
jgi:hypothetical protein